MCVCAQVAESPWLGKVIRVVAEGMNEGRVGKVTSVHEVQGSEPPEYRLQAADEHADKAGGNFLAKHTEVEEQRDD